VEWAKRLEDFLSVSNFIIEVPQLSMSKAIAKGKDRFTMSFLHHYSMCQSERRH
jgi:hypothetical protein